MKHIAAKIILGYLQLLIRLYVKRQGIEIIGLTGSVGKTTLSLAVHSILSTKYKTGVTYKHGHGLNSESGIPFAILDVKVDGYSPFAWMKYLFIATKNFIFKSCKYEKFVVEMGIDKPDDMRFLLSTIEPNTGIFLSFSKAHTANFEHLLNKNSKKRPEDLVFEEKAALIRSLDKGRTAVLNYDHKRIRDLKDAIEAKTITFGLSEEADVYGRVKEISADAFNGEVVYGDQRVQITISNYMINKKMFSTLLAAVAIGVVYNIPLAQSIKQLENLHLPPGRMSKIPGIKGTIIIDSSYNASKLAMFEALDNLALFKNRKKIAILGDMRELGKEAREEHAELAKRAIQIADELVLIGPLMKEYFLPKATELGFEEKKIHHFLSTFEASKFVKDELIQGNEAILVKGSQNTLFLEIIVEEIMKDPSQADKLLCRRGAFWEKQRSALS